MNSYVACWLLGIWSVTALSFEEVDGRTGQRMKIEKPVVTGQVDEPASRPMKPFYLSEESDSRPLQLARTPGASIHLGLEKQGFSTRVAGQFFWNSWFGTEPWISFHRGEGLEEQASYEYAGGVDATLETLMLRHCRLFAKAGLGYSKWSLQDVETVHSPLATSAAGMGFQFTKYFGLEIARSYTYYATKRPVDTASAKSRPGVQSSTEIAFFARL